MDTHFVQRRIEATTYHYYRLNVFISMFQKQIVKRLGLGLGWEMGIESQEMTL